ncbi:M1 family peptidase [Actinomadura rubrisoli]|uniref:Aminopeptidase N n=2 Tax=Actinomadura rubrisoli TaxID=2530368 RepID=A0A4R5B2R2_9ACTN|nr:M1 family metallopeptidase [Actinomadura rubrisoli]TDD79283.1 M1 family peptidase [Actinomadura rubrisoli]
MPPPPHGHAGDTPPGTSTALDDCGRSPSAPDRPVPIQPGSVQQEGAQQEVAEDGAGIPGAAGLGDAYFKDAGNGGYDVAHYDVALAYAGPKTGSVDATVTISAKATQHLSGFNLDYRGPEIVAVTVDGRPVRYRREGQELTVTPASAIPAGRAFTAVVRYSGRPGPIHNESLGTYGWVPSKDGAIIVAEPDGAPTWLPVNDHPRDKATYAFRVTVPKDLRVLANGRPGRTVPDGATTTYEWAEESPMASYLAMVAIGRFEVRETTAGGIPVITAVDPRFKAAAKELESLTVRALKWEATVFGPYPFATAGGIVDDPRLDYALETQERPVYGGFVPDEDFVVHELAHQWFGDSVSVRDWRDIWLNEGFATYAEWLWRERGKKDSAKKIFNRYYRQPAGSPIFVPPPGRPGGADRLFGFSVYVRGAMCLQALRDRVGDRSFFTILRTWADERRHASGTTPQFVALAERISGKRLGGLFDAWLYTKAKPKKW